MTILFQQANKKIMKTTLKFLLIMVFLNMNGTLNAQVFKHLRRGAPAAFSPRGTYGSGYSISAADTLGRLYLLICDSAIKPQPGSIVLNGTYHIEMWNGSIWIKTPAIKLFTRKRFAGDVIKSPTVTQMLVYNGMVIIAGKFDSTSNNLGGGIVAWKTTQWASVGNGLYMSSRWIPNSLKSWFEMKQVFVYKSKLIITGNFDSIKGLFVNGVVQLNPSGIWENLGKINGNVPFHMHRPDPKHFFQVMPPEIDVVLDSMYFYQSIYYVPDKLGFNGQFGPVMNSRQSGLWPVDGIYGTTLYASDGLKHYPVAIPKDFVVRKAFEHNGELNLMGHFDSSLYIRQIARRDANGKWHISNLPDNDSLTVFGDFGLLPGHFIHDKKYVFMGRIRTGNNSPQAVIKLYEYDATAISGRKVLSEDSTAALYRVMQSGKKKYLAGSFLHLREWNSSEADSFINYASEILTSATMVIKGRAFIDWNLDETWQPYEPLLKNKMVYWIDSGHASSTDNSGRFILYLPAGPGRAIGINMNNYHFPAWSDSKIYSSADDTVIKCNFPMDILLDRDLKAELVAYCGSKARRGDISHYAIRICNISGKPVKGVYFQLKLEKKCSGFKSVSPGVVYDSVKQVAYGKFDGSLGGDSSLYFYYSCKYSADSFILGDSVSNTLTVLNYFNDADTSNNTYSIRQMISSAYDPNLKESNPNGRLIQKPDNIRYTIHFQNEGNDTAIKVQVLDTLSVLTPVYEVEIAAASHDFNFTVENSILVWEFDRIKLPAKQETEFGSRGFVSFTAKINKPFKVGDSLRNRAAIYFDYEKPVVTNYAKVVMVKKNNAIDEHRFKMESFSIFPNPSSDRQTIRNISGHRHTLSIYSVSGHLMCELEFNPYEELSIDMEQWAPGIYFVRSSSGAFACISRNP
jgi:uncharacterized repeat protein (TIGR01451 family)